MTVLNKIMCFFFEHDDVPENIQTLFTDNGGWHDVVYSWRCTVCNRLREFER
jgi:hypothetical protein